MLPKAWKTAKLEKRISELAAEHLPEAIVYSRSIPLGPPAPYPVMIRVSGNSDAQVKEYAQKVRKVMAANPYVNMTRLDWLEQTNAVKLKVDNDKLLQWDSHVRLWPTLCRLRYPVIP